MSSGAALQVRGIVAGFGAATVLHGVDFDVRPSEVVAILGLNGAGKSVTLKVLAGLVPARAGSVSLDGEELTALSPEARVGRGIGHVAQGRHVFGEMSVEQNLRLGAYLLRRRDPKEYDAVLAEVLDRFPRLKERLTQRAGTLSGGEQAMLAVGRALMGRPRIILIDEPTAGLSPLVSEQLLETLQSTRETGVTMLLVEQNTRFALDLADRILIMRRGLVAHEASAGDIEPAELASQLGIGRILAAPPAGTGKPSRARSSTSRKAPAKRAGKKAPVKAVAGAKAVAGKRPAKKVTAKQTATKKGTAKKALTKKNPAKKAPARKAPAKKASVKKAAAKKRPAKKAP